MSTLEVSHGSVEEAAFLPLLDTLSAIDFSLKRDGLPPVILAAATLRQFKSQFLPEHVRYFVKKRRGPRVSARGPRHLRTTRLVLARWPEDGQLEAAIPALGYVVSGQADFHIGDYLVQCQAGDFIYFPVGISKPDAGATYVANDPDRQCRILWISPGPLNGQGLECWIVHSQGEMSRAGAEQGTSALKNDFLARLFDRLNQTLLSPGQDAVKLALLRCLVLCVKQELEEGRAAVPWVRRLHRPVPRERSLVEEASKHMESHLDSHLTIEVMARLLAVSPATFTRRFRDGTGQTFNHFLTERRLEGAATLLRDTDLPVREVARMVGLKYERLRDLFQERHGVAPGNFRKHGK